MLEIDVRRQMSEPEVAAVSTLLDAAAAHDDHRPLGDHRWLDLVQGGREGFAVIVARLPEQEQPVGFAQLTRGHDSWAIEFVVHPDHRDGEVNRELLSAALDVVAAEGGGHVHVWIPKPNMADDAVAESCGLHRGRDLLQMRRSLPVGLPWSLDVRTFVPGQDEAAWLDVNNRAFHWHPEQGGWDLDTLKAREAEPWFDTNGFLLHERDARLVGFCWTKIHTDTTPPLGEIYVIAVDPDFAGQGFGRALVLAGLDHLAGRGLTIGMLYVDATNTSARRLYEDLGFTVDHVDRAYVGDVS